MRLIDVDNIHLMDEYIDKIHVNDDFNPYIFLNDFLEIIDKQPTAYDINKVMEELENERGCNDHCSYKGAYCGRGNCRWSIIDDVIDIVEAGGKNED